MTFVASLLLSLLAFFMLNRARRVTAGVLVGVMAFGVALPPARAQILEFPAVLAAITDVVRTINNVIGPLLNTALSILSGINNTLSAFRNLWEQVVYPVDLINRARALVGSMIAQFRASLTALMRASVSSAELANPVALENVIRNRGTGDFAQLEGAFRQTYRNLPAVAAAHPADRDLMDVDDAMALANLKTLKASDQMVDRMMVAANAIEDEGQRMAPGSAPFLAGAGFAAAVKSQAMMQRMIASAIRQEAARIAHDNTLRKRKAVFADDFRRDARQMFKK